MGTAGRRALFLQWLQKEASAGESLTDKEKREATHSLQLCNYLIFVCSLFITLALELNFLENNI